MTLDEQREFLTLFIAHVTIGPALRRSNVPLEARITIEWRQR